MTRVVAISDTHSLHWELKHPIPDGDLLIQAGDSYKIADSNAFKKACYKFGIGRYLGIEGAEEDQHEKTPLTKSSNPFSTKQAKPQVENKGKKNPFAK